MTPFEIGQAADRFHAACGPQNTSTCYIFIHDNNGTPIYQAKITGRGSLSGGLVEAYTDFNGRVDLYSMYSDVETGAYGVNGGNDILDPRVPMVVTKPLFQNLEVDFLLHDLSLDRVFTLVPVFYDPLPPEGGDEGDGRPQDEQDAEGGYLPPDPGTTEGGADAGSGRSGLLWVLLAIGGYLALRK